MIQGENGERIQLTNEKLIGNGSFGVVFQVASRCARPLVAHTGAARAHTCPFDRSTRRSCPARCARPFRAGPCTGIRRSQSEVWTKSQKSRARTEGCDSTTLPGHDGGYG